MTERKLFADSVTTLRISPAPPTGACPLIYPLMGTACFRDVTAGNNGDFTAAPGYDPVTGIGVPNVKELVKALS